MISLCAAHGTCSQLASLQVSGPGLSQTSWGTSWGGIPVSPHLNHVVQRFVKQVYEFAPDVEQVNLAPGDHDAGEGPLIRASTLQRGI